MEIESNCLACWAVRSETGNP